MDIHRDNTKTRKTNENRQKRLNNPYVDIQDSKKLGRCQPNQPKPESDTRYTPNNGHKHGETIQQR